ncbi:MAG: chlorophyll A-B-binding protein, partial [Cyanobacteria bacterium P01_D01_bin.56]
DVRLVTAPTLDFGTLWSYRTHLFDVSSLEDLVGGHIYIGILLILGGAWHILMPPFSWVKQVFLFSADGILSYSLFGLALAGFAASYYCGFNTLAYPVEFYGPTLELKSAFLPSYFDANPSLVDGYTSRTWLANSHFYLAFFFLQGGLWHFQRAMGFDIGSLFENWRQNLAEVSDNPSLVYQNPIYPEPQALLSVQYGAPQFKLPPLLKREQPFESYVYAQSQDTEQPNLAAINGVQRTLYQTTYRTEKNTFYQSPASVKTKMEFGYGARSPQSLYERPKLLAERLDYPGSLTNVIYEPCLTNGHTVNQETATT